MDHKRLFVLFLLATLALSGDRLGLEGAQEALAQASGLPRPTNIKCEGRERDTVEVRWNDTASDETNYRVERQIGTGSFTEVATMTPDSNGRYEAYRDTGANVSAQGRHYRVRSYRASDGAFSPYSDVCNNRRIFESAHFRIFYGLRNTSDDCPQAGGWQVCLADVSSGGNNVYVSRAADVLEDSVAAFKRLGFTRDGSAPPGSLDMVPVNVTWCGAPGCANNDGLGLAPMHLEAPFDLVTRVGDPAAWTTPLHEVFHYQQSKYWSSLADPADNWVIEGQASSIQDKICIGASRSSCEHFDDMATGSSCYMTRVRNYLGQPNQPINRASYEAALFWTYLTEKYGTSAPGDPVEGGMNLIVQFWEESAANPGRDGIAVLNSTLAALGHSARFRDVWKDFAVANYAKDLSGPNVPAKYRYADMAQPGGNYGPVKLSINRTLNVGEQVVGTDQTVQPWGATYYQVRPASSLPIIDIRITQETSEVPVPVYYTVLGIKGDDVGYEHNLEARDLKLTLVNNAYDKVVVIVAGMERLANYDYSFNGTQPVLRILSPTTANKALVGDLSAPGKFLVITEAVGPDGTPLAGVNLSNFSFRIGSQDVPSGNILTPVTVGDKHWFLLRAVPQLAVGRYDLHVSYSTILSDTQAEAVIYQARGDSDNILLIDRSTSMIHDGKIDAAKAAARLYVDSWRAGDRIGVISYNETPTPDMALTDWTDSPGGGSRQTAFNAINSLVAWGNTAIGDTLRMGWNELIENGNSSHEWALILLSDGLETAGTEKFDALIAALGSATGKRPVVHAVAVGPDADRPLMQRLADVTRGSYQAVSAPASPVTASGVDLQLDMDTRYRMIATKVAGLQQFFRLTGPIADDSAWRDSIYIPVENGAAEMVLSLSWYDEDICCIRRVELRDPNDNLVPVFESDTRHHVWRVPAPMGGTWTLELDNTHIVQSQPLEPLEEYLPPYLVQAALRSEVTMDVYLATSITERTPGMPMHVIAGLTDTGPIAGATVTAKVETPVGEMIDLQLYDDGAHNDGVADDGVYANNFCQSGVPGSYNVTAKARGYSPLSGIFSREEILSFYVESSGDRDNDGLPDEWEMRYGTDPDVPDAHLDPDNDGVLTRAEWNICTHPLDPDTDAGGEADGSDPDPLDPIDDGIEPTWAVAYPGIGQVFIRYVLRPQYTTVSLYRAEGPDGPFTLQGEDRPGAGLFIDAQVSDDATYCYFVVASDAHGRRTASLTPSCATPKADPLPPHGWVIINDNAQTTPSPHVQLTLWASDSVDPEMTEHKTGFLPPDDSASGVTHMMISNQGDFSDGVWEPYATSKSWKLDQTSGLAAVFVKYRDAAGNESDSYAATIRVTGPPTAIDLLSFSASGRDDQVTLDWQTAAEIDNEGFNLWRAETADGPYAQINPDLIPAQGSPDTGASYQYVDSDVVRGLRYFYKLEDVDVHGLSAFHGPVSVTASSSRDIYLPLIYKE